MRARSASRTLPRVEKEWVVAGAARGRRPPAAGAQRPPRRPHRLDDARRRDRRHRRRRRSPASRARSRRRPVSSSRSGRARSTRCTPSRPTWAGSCACDVYPGRRVRGRAAGRGPRRHRRGGRVRAPRAGLASSSPRARGGSTSRCPSGCASGGAPPTRTRLPLRGPRCRPRRARGRAQACERVPSPRSCTSTSTRSTRRSSSSPTRRCGASR